MKGYIGAGTLFQVQEPHVAYDPDVPATLPSATVFVTTSRVRSGALGGDTRESVDVTPIDSATDLDDSMGGLRTGGEVQLVLNFRPEEVSFQLLRAAHVAGSERHFRFLLDRLPNKPALAFTGYFTAFEGPTIDPRGLLVVNAKIKVTAPTAAEAPDLYDTDAP